jgi:hypothetical protein
VKVRFACPSCDAPVTVEDPLPNQWQCHCSAAGPLAVPDMTNDAKLSHCVACGNAQVYRQKNFPQWLGLSLLTVACAAFFILQGLYLKDLAWAILLGSAAIDFALYLLVGDVILCYRCGARHLGLPRQKSYEPFDLAIAEKYRQERLRREMAEKK